MGRIAQYVHVAGQVFAPGDEPPVEIARLITNPGAWEGGRVLSSHVEREAATPVVPVGKPVDSESETSGPPPKSGAGSSTEAWLAYARSKGVELPDDAKKDDIIAAVEASEK